MIIFKHNRLRAMTTTCEKCKEVVSRGGWNSLDLSIYHNNNHVWPGYTGEPNSEDYGGSDFE